MRHFKIFILVGMILLLTACTKTTVADEVYENIESTEATTEVTTGATEITLETEVSLDRPGIKAEDVKEDARFYFEPENDNSKWIGINMSFEDVEAALKEEKIDLGEAITYQAGEVTKGWWFDGTRQLQGSGINLSFDKAGNLYEFEISEAYKTSRGIGIGATKDEVLLMYGKPEYIIEFSSGLEAVIIPMDKFSIRFLLENDTVIEILVTETVMQFVLQEFMQ